jgi:hypothetical protein
VSAADLAVNVAAYQGLSPDRIPHVLTVGGFSYAFGRSTAFSVLAGVVGLCLPARVAAAKSPS